MRKHRSSISKATSYEEMGELWDKADLADYWDKTHEVHFDVDIQSETFLYEVDAALATKLQQVARKRGIPARELLNQWLSEKLKARAA